MSVFRQYIFIFILLICIYIYYIIHVSLYNSNQVDYNRIKERIARLNISIGTGRRQIADIKEEISKLTQLFKRARLKNSKWNAGNRKIIGGWNQPIPVLVFVCNRPKAVRNHLNQLLKYRTSREKFPIIVSQDCDNELVSKTVLSFAEDVQYIKHLSGDKANIPIEPGHERYKIYYKIARHYKLGLSYIFDHLKYTSVIITEDDLDVAPDFFEYFSGTRKLLKVDKTLFCVSAWNDNGKSNLVDITKPDLLYRTDFFPGLGWMMTRSFWEEISEIWPNGFWDDWIRDPLRRKNRSCIRPEISRTAMSREGQVGASKGLFFSDHLSKIVLNNILFNFTHHNLAYLLKENYDNDFLKRVYSAAEILWTDLKKIILKNSYGSDAYRIQYSTMEQYIFIAKKLNIMHDFKAGVPRTAYLGVVTCFINNIRIFVAPNRSILRHYDQRWEAPESKN